MQLNHQSNQKTTEFAKSQRGASLVEYALLVALVAVVCIAAVTFVGSRSSDTFTKAATGDVCPPGTHPVPSSELPFNTIPQDAHLEFWCLSD